MKFTADKYWGTTLPSTSASFLVQLQYKAENGNWVTPISPFQLNRGAVNTDPYGNQTVTYLKTEISKLTNVPQFKTGDTYTFKFVISSGNGYSFGTNSSPSHYAGLTRIENTTTKQVFSTSPDTMNKFMGGMYGWVSY